MSTATDFIKWDGSFEIHHELIDSQHRIFVMLLNKLMANIVKGVDKEYLLRVLDEISKYAEFHFVSEENVMYECNFPGLTNHEQVHTEILHRLADLTERVSQNRARAEDVVVMLRGWLFSHILIEDSHISQYVRDHQ